MMNSADTQPVIEYRMILHSDVTSCSINCIARGSNAHIARLVFDDGLPPSLPEGGLGGEGLSKGSDAFATSVATKYPGLALSVAPAA